MGDSGGSPIRARVPTRHQRVTCPGYPAQARHRPLGCPPHPASAITAVAELPSCPSRNHTLGRWGLRPLTGGRNNHVYAWTDPAHGPVCIKIYSRRGTKLWELPRR